MKITGHISSRQNRVLVEASKLLMKKYRDEKGLFTVEGEKLCREACLCHLTFEGVFVTEKYLSSRPGEVENILAAAPDCPVWTVTEECLCKLTKQYSPEGIICICRHIDKSEKINKIYISMHQSEKRLGALLCDRVSDPGNLGTVLRSARAFGLDLVSVSPDSADILSPKVMRAAMGAAFMENIVVCDTKSQIMRLKELGFTVYAAVLGREAVGLDEGVLAKKSAVVIGNEGQGLGEDVIALCDKCLYIPMAKGSESLNAAVAASVIMYQMKLV